MVGSPPRAVIFSTSRVASSSSESACSRILSACAWYSSPITLPATSEYWSTERCWRRSALLRHSICFSTSIFSSAMRALLPLGVAAANEQARDLPRLGHAQHPHGGRVNRRPRGDRGEHREGLAAERATQESSRPFQLKYDTAASSAPAASIRTTVEISRAPSMPASSFRRIQPCATHITIVPTTVPSTIPAISNGP